MSFLSALFFGREKRLPEIRLRSQATDHDMPDTVKNRVLEPIGLGTCWQKFAILIPKNIRSCLAKQDQAGS